MNMVLSFVAAWLATAAAAPAILDGVAVFTGSGYPAAALTELRAALGEVPASVTPEPEGNHYTSCRPSLHGLFSCRSPLSHLCSCNL